MVEALQTTCKHLNMDKCIMAITLFVVLVNDFKLKRVRLFFPNHTNGPMQWQLSK